MLVLLIYMFFIFYENVLVNLYKNICTIAGTL